LGLKLYASNRKCEPSAVVSPWHIIFSIELRGFASHMLVVSNCVCVICVITRKIRAGAHNLYIILLILYQILCMRVGLCLDPSFVLIGVDRLQVVLELNSCSLGLI
jgi:hypothetical protein